MTLAETFTRDIAAFPRVTLIYAGIAFAGALALTALEVATKAPARFQPVQSSPTPVEYEPDNKAPEEQVTPASIQVAQPMMVRVPDATAVAYLTRSDAFLIRGASLEKPPHQSLFEWSALAWKPRLPVLQRDLVASWSSGDLYGFDGMYGFAFSPIARAGYGSFRYDDVSATVSAARVVRQPVAAGSAPQDDDPLYREFLEWRANRAQAAGNR